MNCQIPQQAVPCRYSMYDCFDNSGTIPNRKFYMTYELGPQKGRVEHNNNETRVECYPVTKMPTGPQLGAALPACYGASVGVSIPTPRPVPQDRCPPLPCHPIRPPTGVFDDGPPPKTVYVTPCYRYEDGRVEPSRVPVLRRLPMSVYKRNGIQDHLYGLNNAMCVLSAGPNNNIYAEVFPIKRDFRSITAEVDPVKPKRKYNKQDTYLRLQAERNAGSTLPRETKESCAEIYL